ncbi:U3 small nucleolar RNA-associated protein 7 [Cryptococcus neoformans]|nr:U3 small nucleolar RNA-associated protein 7 [Cryptococcus neoformans var. grubii]
MEFLPFHYLLSTVGNAGYLKYHDTSTGVMLTQIPTRLGSSPPRHTYASSLPSIHINSTSCDTSTSSQVPHDHKISSVHCQLAMAC